MTEQIQNAVRACAEHRVPDAADPWPEIRERVASKPRRSSRARYVPRTRAGWAFAALLVMLFGMGAYAASEVAYEAFREELPGAADEENVGVLINERQTAQGAGVTLERVYADAGYIVVSFSVEDLKDERRVAGQPAELLPVFNIEEPWYEKTGGSPPWPRGVPHVDITDGSGRDYQVIDATGEGSYGENIFGEPRVMKGPKAQTTVFAATETLDSGKGHHFRLEIPLQAEALTSPGEKGMPPEPVGEPFVFDFEAPVQPTPIVEVDQKSEASGLTLRLDRVVESPGRPHAVICFAPPDEGYVWEPLVQKAGSTAEDDPGYDLEKRQMENGCWAIDLYRHADSYSLTVPHITGYPKVTGQPESDPAYDPQDKRTIRGPWKFELEVPER